MKPGLKFQGSGFRVQIALGVCVLAMFVAVTTGGVAYAQGGGSYDLSWWTIDGGGGAVGGETYTLLSTAGQPDAGPALSDAAERFTLLGGFWPARAVEGGYTVYLPLVLRTQ